MNIDGTIGEYRFVLLSNNTLANKIEDLSSTGSEKYLIGSIEINLFNNKNSGKVYLTNLEYDKEHDIFTACDTANNNSQICIEIFSNKNTDGSIASPPREVSAENKALLLVTSEQIQNEKMIINFYAADNLNNHLSGKNYDAHFSFLWED